MASRGVNKVILMGNVGGDPEMRYAPSGTAFANLSIATSESWKDKQTGEQQERTEWHKVVFSGRLAEIVGDYVRKGSKIYIEGQLRTRKWQGQDGRDNYTTEILVGINGNMQLLDPKQDGDQPRQQRPQNQGQGNQQRTQQQRQPQGQQQPAQDYDDEFDQDIPF